MRSDAQCECGHTGRDHALSFVGTTTFVECTVCDNTMLCPYLEETELIDLVVEYR